jgi:hypothetical protein
VQLGGFAPAFALPVGGSEGLRKETNANRLGCYWQAQKKMADAEIKSIIVRAICGDCFAMRRINPM